MDLPEPAGRPPIDDVLVAFHAACPRPTAEDLALWVDRHPDLADDLRDHAEALLAAAQNHFEHLMLAHADRMYLRAQATARAPEGLAAVFLRAPAAC